MEKRGYFRDSTLRDVYTKVLSLFSVLAVQEVSQHFYQMSSKTLKLYDRAWGVSHSLNRERLGFAYDIDKVALDKCTVLNLSIENYNKQRPAYACVFKELQDHKVQ